MISSIIILMKIIFRLSHLIYFFTISFTLLISSNEELILKSTGTKLLQIGIVILGLTISSSGAINLTTKYFPYINEEGID